MTSPSLIRPTGRHRKPRESRSARLIRGGFLSGFVGTVAVSASAAQAAESPAETSLELPAVPDTLPGGYTPGAVLAAEATLEYAERIEHRAARAQAEEAARRTAARLAAEAAAEAEAERAAERAAEREAAEEERRRAAAEAVSRTAGRTALPSPASVADEPAPAPSGNGSGVVGFALAQVGDAYVLGATGPDAWDCSSLVQAAYASAGVSLPRTSQAQSALGTPVSLDALQPGDILHWGGRGSAHHVALYIGGGQFVGAQNSGTGVVTRSLDWDTPTGALRL
ncbi:C40 family peptidase [Streptomyces aidingensis]|nr:C40 family peptidase [Streptomyces aidingensis]